MLNVECYHAVTYQIPRDYYYFLHFTHITFYIFKFYHRKHRVVTALHTFTMQLQQRTVPSNQKEKRAALLGYSNRHCHHTSALNKRLTS